MKYKPPQPGDLYSKGRFNKEVFALRVWGTYIWRRLFSEFYVINSAFLTVVFPFEPSSGYLGSAQYIAP